MESRPVPGAELIAAGAIFRFMRRAAWFRCVSTRPCRAGLYPSPTRSYRPRAAWKAERLPQLRLAQGWLRSPAARPLRASVPVNAATTAIDEDHGAVAEAGDDSGVHDAAPRIR